MYTLFLSLHILSVVITVLFLSQAVYTIYTSGLANKEIKRMRQGFVSVIASGFGLLVITPHSFGRFCILATILSVSVIAIELYHRRTTHYYARRRI